MIFFVRPYDQFLFQNSNVTLLQAPAAFKGYSIRFTVFKKNRRKVWKINFFGYDSIVLSVCVCACACVCVSVHVFKKHLCLVFWFLFPHPSFLASTEPFFQKLGIFFSQVMHEYMFNIINREYYKELMCKTLITHFHH